MASRTSTVADRVTTALASRGWNIDDLCTIAAALDVPVESLLLPARNESRNEIVRAAGELMTSGTAYVFGNIDYPAYLAQVDRFVDKVDAVLAEIGR